MNPLVYHYTTEKHHLPMILADGILRPSNLLAEDELPLVWFSLSKTYEPTAIKHIVDYYGRNRALTFREQVEQFGCVRLSLPVNDQRLMNWRAACRHAGTSSWKRKALERSGKRQGAKPSHWFAAPNPIPVEDCRLQRFDGAKWFDVCGRG